MKTYLPGCLVACLWFPGHASAQNVGIGTTDPDSTLTIQNKLLIGGSQGDIIFTDDEGSITFPATTAPNAPMIQLFGSGDANADRMVLAHSAAFPTRGLQYTDSNDRFHFLSNGENVATFDLTNKRMGLGTSTPFAQFHFQSTNSGRMIFEGPNNYFDFYNTNPSFMTGLRFFNSGSEQGGMYYSPANDYVFFSQNSTANGLLIDLSSNRKLGIATTTLPADHQVGIGGNVHIMNGSEAGLLTHGFLQAGPMTGFNLVMDNNEIMARNNGTASTLYLQPDQGNVAIGSTLALSTKLLVDAESGLAPLRVRTGSTTRLFVSPAGEVAINSSSTSVGGVTSSLFIQGVTGAYALRTLVAGTTRLAVDSAGAVMINTLSEKKPGYELNVNGQIVAEEVLVQNSTNWPDYVFADDYSLRDLSDVEAFITTHKHLPDVPSAVDMEKDGINLGEMDKTLLRKIEELTLYLLEIRKDVERLRQENEMLKAALLRKDQ